MNKQSLQQTCENNWAEDEAFGAYMDYCLGWRNNPDISEDDYQLRRQLDIDYYKTKVFNNEPDRDQLIKRFISAYDATDIEHKDALPE